MNATSASPATPTKPLSIWRLGAYSALQLPAAMGALPIVLNVSYFYPNVFHANLYWMGAIFLFTRAVDALQDPLIGYYSDRLTRYRNGRLYMVLCSVPILCLGFYGVFTPPALEGGSLLIYLTGILMLAHLGYSGVTIGYQALGAELSYDYHERTRVTVTRELFGIIGLLLGSALPTKLTESMGEIDGYARLALIYLPILLICAAIVWFFSPRAVTPPVVQHQGGNLWRNFAAPLRNRRFRLLLAVYLVNGTSVAIAASVVLFYIEDVVAAKTQMAWFILTYFGAGVASVPAWLWLARRTSKSITWAAGVAVSVVGLTCAALVGPGDVALYIFVCGLAGFGLGADYGLPPSILADVIHNEVSDSQGESGKYFGLWQMATKLMTAIGGGVALPLLAAMGYQSGAGGSTWPLLITYAILPALVKSIAGIMLWFLQVEATRPSVRDQILGARAEHKPIIQNPASH